MTSTGVVSDRRVDRYRGASGRARYLLSYSARFFGPMFAGVCEVSLFHPLDTVAKRIIVNTTRITSDNTTTAAHKLYKVVFPNVPQSSSSFKSAFNHVRALYPGMAAGLLYKVSQRIIKFGGQPILRDALTALPTGRYMTKKYGEKANVVIETVAGASVGMLEPILTPFDVIKIKFMTNPGAVHSRSILRILMDENFRDLYRGFWVTVARNSVGSSLLFSGSAATKLYVFGGHDSHGRRTRNKRPGLVELFVSSSVGAVVSLSLGSPLDVLKTRQQHVDFNTNRSTLALARHMLKHEGVRSFFKGLAPKLITICPKLIFSFTVAEYMINVFKNL